MKHASIKIAEKKYYQNCKAQRENLSFQNLQRGKTPHVEDFHWQRLIGRITGQ